MEYSEKIINAFRNECTDLMNSLEEYILLLEKEPDNSEHINEIFRIVHSLKSETALMGFTNFSTLAHRFEDLFQKLRSNELVVNDIIIETTFKVYDEFKTLFNSIINNKTDAKDISEVLDLIKSTLQEPAQIQTDQDTDEKSELSLTNQEILQFTKQNYQNIFYIKIAIFENVALKYARAFLIYNNLSGVGEIAKTSVNFLQEEKDSKYTNFVIILLTNSNEKEIYDLVDVSEVERVSIKKVTTKHAAAKEEKKEQVEDISANSIRVDIDKIENLMTSVGELIVNYNRAEKFYEFMNNQNFIFNKINKSNLSDIISQFKRIIDGLQDDVMKIRMIPIKTLFGKFPRLIRNLSREMKKKVNLSITGEYTEIDKTVIEELREPLTHIIRNCIDHGIEKPEERKQKRKNTSGTLKISSFQSGNNIVIKITDDGQGIDLDKIKRKALEKRLMTGEQINSLSDRQILEFIFMPGFSTKSEVSEVSGRGVGMDIVRNNIRKLQGKINLVTKKDIGTSIIISIPITIAIVNSLIIKCSDVFFAIPLYFIQETLRIYEDEIQIVDRYEVIQLRKKLLSILQLNQILDLNKFEKKAIQILEEDIIAAFRKKKHTKKKHFIVVINLGNKQIGLIVDQLISEQDIVIKPLSRFIDEIDGISGVTILGDGNIAYILDPIKLVSFFLSKHIKDIPQLKNVIGLQV